MAAGDTRSSCWSFWYSRCVLCLPLHRRGRRALVLYISLVNFGTPHTVRRLRVGPRRPCGSRAELPAILGVISVSNFGVLEPKKLDQIVVNFDRDPPSLLNRVRAVSTVYCWLSNTKYTKRTECTKISAFHCSGRNQLVDQLGKFRFCPFEESKHGPGLPKCMFHNGIARVLAGGGYGKL